MKTITKLIADKELEMAAMVEGAISMLQDSGARVAAIRLYREAAKVVKAEESGSSSDPSEDWLMQDDSILHVGNPNGECFTPYVREVELDTIGGKLLLEELREMYQSRDENAA